MRTTRIHEEDFHRITLDDKPDFDRIFRQYPISNSENTFGTLFCWGHYGNYTYQIVDGCLVIRGETELYQSFRTPIGPRNKDILDAVVDLALETGQENPLLVLEPWQQLWVREVRPDLVLSQDRNFSEYVYRTEDLAVLPGKSYLMIRKQLNRYRSRCTSTVEPVTPDNVGEIHEFLAKWCQWRECDKYTILKQEKQAILLALDRFEELGLSGLAIRAQNGISGLAIYEELNPSTAVIHFEKGLPDCEGIYKEINNQTALALRDTYQYINRESDMGMPGLRESKERYHPDHMVDLYYLDTARTKKLRS
jgi:hypothetical protein